MFISFDHFRVFCLTLLLSILPITVIAATQTVPRGTSEVGVATLMENGEPAEDPIVSLTELGGEINVGLGYGLFMGEGMKETYTGMPQIGAGISFLIAPYIRTFIRLDYMVASGDPYSSALGFDAPDETTVKSIPMTFGLKFNLSQNQKIRLPIGLGAQVAWQQEETLGLLPSGDFGTRTASGFNTGFVVTFGPEIVLGKGGNILGIEFGVGGSKGDIRGDGYNHNIDMTGFTTRAYYTFGI